MILFWLAVFLIIYTYLGYPALLGLLARFKPVVKKQESYEPTVTLLIAAYNEEKVIAGKLENSLDLDYPAEKLQILVAADGSDDRTVEIVKGFAEKGISLSFSHQRQGKMAAINRAMVVASGDIVLFSDANNLYTENVIRAMTAPFVDTQVGGVSGAKRILSDGELLGDSEGLYWQYESWIKKQESRLGTCTGTAGEIFAIRRDLYIPPPRAIINDDFFMAMQILRQGKQIKYVSEAISMEPASLHVEDEIIRRERIVAGRYQAMTMSGENLPWRHPLVVWQIISHKYLRPLVPFAMIFAYLVNFVALFQKNDSKRSGWADRIRGLLKPVNWVLIIVQTLFYFLALLGMKQGNRKNGSRLLYLPAFLVNSNLAALKGFVRFVSGDLSVNWKKVERQVIENE